jgi:DNA mismatch repair ATPase MutS
MTFYDILFPAEASVVALSSEAPACFADLNLDQVMDAITDGRQEYDLRPFFCTPLRDSETIRYRQAIARDLEDKALLACIKSFADQMQMVRRYLALAKKLSFRHHREGWFLEAARVYCEAVTGLRHDLAPAALASDGLSAFREYLAAYVDSDQFTVLLGDTVKLKGDLAAIKYCMIIKDGTVKVRRYEGETDYSVEVSDTFAKFRQGAVKDYGTNFTTGSGMSHVGARILDCVARLHPDEFAALNHYCDAHSAFADETIRVFDRQVQFYVAYLEYIAGLKKAGLAFCYPQISCQSKQVHADDSFDLALAHQRVAEGAAVVSNSFFLTGPERVIVVSGPNQGGKTTFARLFGQLHYLASLGCPVPGSRARLYLFDRLLTHFEKEEDIRNLRGKLQDDLVRISAILERATPDSIIILNEIFASTTLEDAVFLSSRIMERIMQLDLLCVCVTFIDELASLSAKTVSMVSTVVPENPAERTFKIVRKPADGLAYAISIVEKHRLTFEQIKERIRA